MLKQVFNLDGAPNPAPSGAPGSGGGAQRCGAGGKSPKIAGAERSGSITTNPLLSWGGSIGGIATQITFSAAPQTISESTGTAQAPPATPSTGAAGRAAAAHCRIGYTGPSFQNGRAPPNNYSVKTTAKAPGDKGVENDGLLWRLVQPLLQASKPARIKIGQAR